MFHCYIKTVFFFKNEGLMIGRIFFQFLLPEKCFPIDILQFNSRAYYQDFQDRKTSMRMTYKMMSRRHNNHMLYTLNRVTTKNKKKLTRSICCVVQLIKQLPQWSITIRFHAIIIVVIRIVDWFF